MFDDEYTCDETTSSGSSTIKKISIRENSLAVVKAFKGKFAEAINCQCVRMQSI